MEYLSREELEDITTSLLNNPTRETLKELNKKYNGEVKEEVSEVVSNINIEVPTNLKIDSPSSEIPSFEQNSMMVNNYSKEVPSMEQTYIPAFEVPTNLEINSTPSVDMSFDKPNQVDNNAQMPNLEVPNNAVPFSGNLWEPQTPNIGNLMETTDNFGTMPNTMPNMDNNQSVPFFNPMDNNPQMSGEVRPQPSMFGQIQDSYKAA